MYILWCSTKSSLLRMTPDILTLKWFLAGVDHETTSDTIYTEMVSRQGRFFNVVGSLLMLSGFWLLLYWCGFFTSVYSVMLF